MKLYMITSNMRNKISAEMTSVVRVEMCLYSKNRLTLILRVMFWHLDIFLHVTYKDGKGYECAEKKYFILQFLRHCCERAKFNIQYSC